MQLKASEMEPFSKKESLLSENEWRWKLEVERVSFSKSKNLFQIVKLLAKAKLAFS